MRTGTAAILCGLLAGALLSGCADRFDGYAPLPGAVQRPHAAAMPQLTRDGRLLTGFEAETALLPLALGGALVDYRDGVRRGFQDAYAAGFNSVVADPGQPPQAVRAAAAGSRVLALTDDAVPAGDLARLDARPAILVPVDGTPDLDRLAAAIRESPGRPVWALLRAHAAPARGQQLPDPATATMLAFAALASGAGGLIWQGEDNYAARNAGMLGMAAAPSLDYGIRTDPDSGRQPYRATPDDVAAARRLWDTVTALNRRVDRLAPMLLRPDDATGYGIAIAGTGSGDGGIPLRSLLKPWDGGDDPRRLLIVVNTGRQATDFRVAFDRPLVGVDRWQDTEVAPPDADPARGLFRDRIAPQGVRLYRITL